MAGSLTESLLEGLDPGQRKAVTDASRHILVVAPPGSGKTRVLSCRFARLLKEGASPEGLLAVTFTNRAAREMKERIAGLTCSDTRSLDISTFHAFALKLLKKTVPKFSLWGRDDTVRALKELGVKNPEKAARTVSAIKDSACEPSGEDAEVFASYSGALKSAVALDLDDLIPEATKALEAGIAGRVEKTHIMVDEYQDINPTQARLVKVLSDRGASVLAIGDPDQAIYSFRGSSVISFLEFKDDYPGASVINLNNNYRSGGAIVHASSELISHNAGRLENRAVAVRPGGVIRHVECADERAQADFIIEEIERLMGGLTNLSAGDGDLGFSDFAVLTRTNFEAESLADAFSRSSIPYYRAQDAGKSLSDFVSRLREAAPATGATLEGFMREEGRLMGLSDDLLERFVSSASGLKERTAVEVLDEYLEEAALTEPADYLDIKADRVSLLTMHMAKGLEFKAVFIAGFEDGGIPYVRGAEAEDEDEAAAALSEERRLFYVGMTRARDTLYLVAALRRRLWGAERETRPSRFFRELPGGLVKRVSVERKKARKKPVQKGLFE